MRLSAIVVAGFLVAGAAQAQQTKAPSATVVKLISPGCPGRLTADRQAKGATMWTTALEDKGRENRARQGGSLGVHVEFDGAKEAVTSMELSVAFLPPGLRLMPVAGDGREESTKTFDLAAGGASHVDGNLLVGRAASITRVHLKSVTWADGTVWRAANEDTCTVQPGLLMAVNGW